MRFTATCVNDVGNLTLPLEFYVFIARAVYIAGEANLPKVDSRRSFSLREMHKYTLDGCRFIEISRVLS